MKLKSVAREMYLRTSNKYKLGFMNSIDNSKKSKTFMIMDNF